MLRLEPGHLDAERFGRLHLVDDLPGPLSCQLAEQHRLQLGDRARLTDAEDPALVTAPHTVNIAPDHTLVAGADQVQGQPQRGFGPLALLADGAKQDKGGAQLLADLLDLVGLQVPQRCGCDCWP